MKTFTVVGDPADVSSWRPIDMNVDACKGGETFVTCDNFETLRETRKWVLTEIINRRKSLGKVMEKWYNMKG
jgi:hypothetical protein